MGQSMSSKPVPGPVWASGVATTVVWPAWRQARPATMEMLHPWYMKIQNIQNRNFILCGLGDSIGHDSWLKAAENDIGASLWEFNQLLHLKTVRFVLGSQDIEYPSHSSTITLMSDDRMSLGRRNTHPACPAILLSMRTGMQRMCR